MNHTPFDWKRLKHLTPQSQPWGDASRLNPLLLLSLDALIDVLQSPIHVDCGTQGTHIADSQHGLGNACDFIILSQKLPFFDTLVAITRFPFSGIGYYPAWELNGMKRGGWHVDVRPLPDMKGHRWLGVPDATAPKGSGSQIYLPLNAENLKAFFAGVSVGAF